MPFSTCTYPAHFQKQISQKVGTWRRPFSAGPLEARRPGSEAIDDPAAAVSEVGDGWFAFHYPAIEGTTTPCCWSGRWNDAKRMGCSLEKQSRNFGTTSGAADETTIVAYVRVDDGAVTRLRVAGARCPMASEARLRSRPRR